MTRTKLVTLKEPFIFQVPELRQYHLHNVLEEKGRYLRINEQFLEISGLYGSDICSPKFVIWGKVFGTWDGKPLTVVEEQEVQALPVLKFNFKGYQQYRQLTRAAFIHDILCYFLDKIAILSGQSEAEIRYLADCVFDRECGDFLYKDIYYIGLRAYGRLKYGKR